MQRFPGPACNGSQHRAGTKAARLPHLQSMCIYPSVQILPVFLMGRTPGYPSSTEQLALDKMFLTVSFPFSLGESPSFPGLFSPFT